MKRMILNLATLLVGVAFGLLIRPRTMQVPGLLDPVSTTSATPTLESIRSLASLVTTKVVVSDVQLTQLQGYTGAASAALLVRGDFTLGTDLARATLSHVDPDKKAVVITLDAPAPGNPRVDLNRTRLVSVGTTGLWDVLPGHEVEALVADEAYREAQGILSRASHEPEWKDQAERQARTSDRHFLEAFRLDGRGPLGRRLIL